MCRRTLLLLLLLLLFLLQFLSLKAEEAAGSDENTVPHIQYSELDVESSPLAAGSAMLVRGKLSLPWSFKLRQSQVCPASETELRKPF